MNGDEYARICDECGKGFRIEDETGSEFDYNGYVMCSEHRLQVVCGHGAYKRECFHGGKCGCCPSCADICTMKDLGADLMQVTCTVCEGKFIGKSTITVCAQCQMKQVVEEAE